MRHRLLALRIEELLLEHREVEREGVEKYVRRFLNGEEVEPVSASYCVHSGKYYLDEGHTGQLQPIH